MLAGSSASFTTNRRPVKLLWHDGIGLCMLTKKLEHGQFVWPSTTTTAAARTALSTFRTRSRTTTCGYRRS
ncbi:MAG: transposase [Candidatus Aminicenantes bacterium]|nr:transposase [Candidatus Aminicenantes bacterium]